MKKYRKGTQLNLINPKNAGRRAIHDRGIRHITREMITKKSCLHLTIKLNKAQIQNKTLLKSLKYAIMRARLQGLRVIHYSLEHNHVHFYVECESNLQLTRSMKAFGVSFAKKINAYFKTKGRVYKHRLHLRILKSATEVKNVIHYILNNGIKHKRTKKVFDPYNSSWAVHNFVDLGFVEFKGFETQILKKYPRIYFEFKQLLDELVLYKNELSWIK